jgi:hypothetical protein
MVLAAAALVGGCDGGKGEEPAARPAVTATAHATAASSAAPSTTVASTRAGAEPSAAPSGSEAPGKTYDCGAKGQKPCPMQGWMKTVMADATSSGDAKKMASALEYAAARPPPGFPEWVAMAKAGAAKAKAGDVDGAKESCKQCHDAYKDKYKATMRDRPF